MTQENRRGGVVLALMAAVIAADQAAKWWAWRHVPWARINAGGDVLVGHRIGAWFADPVSGALLDLLDVGVLGLAVLVLARGRLNGAAWATGALIIGGWGSNLLDRLGLHYWTAPDSVRGAVDFIHVDGLTTTSPTSSSYSARRSSRWRSCTRCWAP